MASKDDPLGIVKSGHEIPKFQIKAAGRIFQLTQDGSNWEIRIHMMSDLSAFAPGTGLGEEIIGEVIIRSFNGGIAPLAPMAIEAQRTAQALVNKLMAQFAEAEKRAGGIKIAREIPADLKNRN